MKKIRCSLFLAFVLAATACEESKNDQPARQFAVEPATRTLEFTASDDALVHFRVEATGIGKWQAFQDRDWIVVAQESEGFTVSVRPFDSYETSRQGSVAVTADGFDPVRIAVTQLGKEPALRIDPEQVDFPAFFYPTDTDEERQRRVRITTDAPLWEAEIDEADSWLEIVTKSGDELVLTAPDNQYTERTAAVTVRAGSVTKTLTVVQQAALVPYDGFEGEYTASGTPSVWNGTVNEGPGTWTTAFVAGATPQEGICYIADNYGGKGETLSGARIFIHWLQGRPTIYSPLALGFKSKEGYDAYQLLFIIKEDGLPYIMEGSQDGIWDARSATMDFSGKNSSGYAIIAGIAAVAYEQGDPVIKGTFTEGYADLKFTRRGSSSAGIPDPDASLPAPACDREPHSALRELPAGAGQRPLSELPRLRQ